MVLLFVPTDLFPFNKSFSFALWHIFIFLLSSKGVILSGKFRLCMLPYTCYNAGAMRKNISAKGKKGDARISRSVRFITSWKVS